MSTYEYDDLRAAVAMVRKYDELVALDDAISMLASFVDEYLDNLDKTDPPQRTENQ